MVPADYGTPQRLITMALRDAGKIARDQTPDSEWFLEGMQRLADLLYFQQTQGLKLWLLQDITVPIVSGTQTYTFGPSGMTVMNKPFRVDFGYATTGTNQNRREITPISYNDWARLSNTTQEGLVTQYFVDKQLTNLSVKLWLIPNDEQVSDGEVHLVMRTKANHLETLTETMTFPPELYLALRWALASEFASGSPVTVQQRCMTLSERYLEALNDFDIEDVPVQFQVERGQTSSGGFR